MNTNNFWKMIDKIIKEIDAEEFNQNTSDLDEFFKELKEELKK